MERKLYDCVPVHGKQGLRGGQKAYACYNCMEFFAELSVAFLWQKDRPTPQTSPMDLGSPFLISNSPKDYQGDTGTEGITCEIEYNKWYPHNFLQLRDHDIDSCGMLASIWEVNLKNVLCNMQNIPGKYDSVKLLDESKDSMTVHDLYYTNN